MSYTVSHWSRRSEADRDDLGEAALEWCNAARAYAGASTARFYWTGPDDLVTVTEVRSADPFETTPPPELTSAMLHLADKARRVREERWIAPGEGEERYRAAMALRERLNLP